MQKLLVPGILGNGDPPLYCEVKPNDACRACTLATLSAPCHYVVATHVHAAWIKHHVERTLEIDINMRDTLHRNALHWAAELGAVEAAELLIDLNIDIKVRV